MKRRVRFGVGLLLVVLLAGCAGAGPAAHGTTGGRSRCSPGGPDDQRPLFYLFCLESP